MKSLLPCPTVSVIIPIYNAENYIGECLESILAQTLQNFEVIAVDDCSTDTSPAIVENYREKFGKRLICTRTKKNSGNAGYTARNKGFTFARGCFTRSRKITMPTLSTRARAIATPLRKAQRLHATESAEVFKPPIWRKSPHSPLTTRVKISTHSFWKSRRYIGCRGQNLSGEIF